MAESEWLMCLFEGIQGLCMNRKSGIWYVFPYGGQGKQVLKWVARTPGGHTFIRKSKLEAMGVALDVAKEWERPIDTTLRDEWEVVAGVYGPRHLKTAVGSNRVVLSVSVALTDGYHGTICPPTAEWRSITAFTSDTEPPIKEYGGKAIVKFAMEGFFTEGKPTLSKAKAIAETTYHWWQAGKFRTSADAKKWFTTKFPGVLTID